MLEFPRMVLKPGKQWQLETGLFDLRIVSDQAEYDEALSSGWFADQYDAKGQREEVKEEQETAEEVLTDLEALAKKKGIKIDKRWSEARLRRELGL